MTIKQKFKISGMHCVGCSMNIDGELEDTQGIKRANTNFAKAQTEVEFDKDEIKEEAILKIIEKVGYGAKTIDS